MSHAIDTVLSGFERLISGNAVSRQLLARAHERRELVQDIINTTYEQAMLVDSLRRSVDLRKAVISVGATEFLGENLDWYESLDAKMKSHSLELQEAALALEKLEGSELSETDITHLKQHIQKMKCFLDDMESATSQVEKSISEYVKK